MTTALEYVRAAQAKADAIAGGQAPASDIGSVAMMLSSAAVAVDQLQQQLAAAQSAALRSQVALPGQNQRFQTVAGGGGGGGGGGLVVGGGGGGGTPTVPPSSTPPAQQPPAQQQPPQGRTFTPAATAGIALGAAIIGGIAGYAIRDSMASRSTPSRTLRSAGSEPALEEADEEDAGAGEEPKPYANPATGAPPVKPRRRHRKKGT